MKTYSLLLFFIVLVSNRSFAQSNIQDSINYISGCWVYHSEFGFQLIHVFNKDSVLVYDFVDREREFGVKDPKLKYGFFSSSGFIVPTDDNEYFSIQTDKYRLDFINKDKYLVEYGKQGVEKILIKVE